MGDFNWLHLSDLHLKQFETFDTMVMRDALMESLGTLKDVKYIFITGDIANKFEYGNAVEMIADIKKATGVTDENIFWSVGNHDIYRENRSRNAIIKRLRNTKTRNDFEDIIRDSENRHLLYDFEFQDFYNRHGEFLGYVPPIENRPHAFYEREDLCIINLNTCITSYDDNDAHNLHIIEPNILKVFEKRYNKPVFVLGHHAIDFLCDKEKEKVQELFDGKVDLYLCGHAHRLGYMLIPNTETEVHEITCGGGIADGYSVYSFIYGKYCSDTKSIKVDPYSYRDKGNKKWLPDYGLHKKLNEDEVFYFKRLMSEKERRTLIKAQKLINDLAEENKEEEDLSQVSKKVYDIIDKYHIDKRVKDAVDMQGLEVVCEKYTKYFAAVSQIPEMVNYIKDTCMFKELAEIIIDTNHKFPLYISGEIGTGKSSFLTLLYLALKKWGDEIVPLYFDLHSFEMQDKQGALKRFEEETKLFETIISQEKNRDIVLFIDGLDEHNRFIGDLGRNWIDKQINRLHNSNNKKIISLGYWREEGGIFELLKMDDIEPMYTITLKHMSILMGNDFVEKFVETQKYNKKDIAVQTNKIKECIERWRLEKVDFRLLCMILDSTTSFQNADNYTIFLKKYCMKKLGYKENELFRVAREAFLYNESNFMFDCSEWNKNTALIFRHREICSFLIAYHYVSILKGKNNDEKKQLCKKQFVFSKESNLHVKNLIIHEKESQLNIYQFIKSSLSDMEMSFDMRAQFCYLLPRTFDRIEAEEIKRVLQTELKKVVDKLNELEDGTYSNYEYLDRDKELVLLSRTIACSLAICGEFNSLYDWIKKILRDKRYRNLNHQFYCDYYSNGSKEESLENIGLAEVNKESIDVTLLLLRHQIRRAVNSGSFRNYDLFVLDVVTYFTIVQDYMRDEEKGFTKEQLVNAQKLLELLLTEEQAIKRLKKVQELYDYLFLLKLNINFTSSKGVLERIYSLKTSKRAGWETRGIENGESIADHTFGAYILGLLYLPEKILEYSDVDYSGYCKERILTMILLHDIGEAYTGDIIATQKTDEQKFYERQIIRAIFMSGTYEEVASLENYKEIWEEFIKNTSVNAKLAHEIDKIENLVQLLIYHKEGYKIDDFNKWKSYLRGRMITEVGKSIYDFIENSFV